MDQKSISAKNSTIIQGAAVRTCELRLERHTGTANGTEGVEYLCGASGGPEHGSVLGVSGEDLSSVREFAFCSITHLDWDGSGWYNAAQKRISSP